MYPVTEYQRRVVCSANRCPETGALVLGARHFDTRMLEQIKVYQNSGHSGSFNEEGFIDQHGVFMDRQEAWTVASKAGQIIRRVGGDASKGGTLYSENLY